jgi:hypothetical protein
MTIEEVPSFRTSDGEFHATRALAVAHERREEFLSRAANYAATLGGTERPAERARETRAVNTVVEFLAFEAAQE